jgi:hypothetical protein
MGIRRSLMRSVFIRFYGRRLHRACFFCFSIFCILFLDSASALGSDKGWSRVEWRGEQAWASASKGWTAIVSEERARLVSITPPRSDENLLFAELKNEFSWGGHRFWLGPQSEWSAVWPPPADWERSAAASVEVSGKVLRVEHPRTHANYPGLVRTYEWKEGVLHCAASWQDARFHGIHILQLPTMAVVRVERRITESLPLGYVLLPIFRRNELLTAREVSPAVAKVSGNEIILRTTGTSEKIGVPPQDIVAEIGAYRLTMRRGKMEGMAEATPDLGMLTQVFLGSDENVFTEIEQLTPLGGLGTAVSEILIEPDYAEAGPHRP